MQLTISDTMIFIQSLEFTVRLEIKTNNHVIQ